MFSWIEKLRMEGRGQRLAFWGPSPWRATQFSILGTYGFSSRGVPIVLSRNESD